MYDFIKEKRLAPFVVVAFYHGEKLNGSTITERLLSSAVKIALNSVNH